MVTKIIIFALAVSALACGSARMANVDANSNVNANANALPPELANIDFNINTAKIYERSTADHWKKKGENDPALKKILEKEKARKDLIAECERIRYEASYGSGQSTERLSCREKYENY